MIKPEHFNYNGFDISKYLALENPNKNVYTNSRFREDSIHICQKQIHEFKQFIISTYNLTTFCYNYFNNQFGFNLYYGVDYSVLNMYYIDNFDYEEFINNIQHYLHVNKNLKLPKVNFIAISDRDYYLIEKNLPKETKIDLENSYNLSYNLDNIMKDIKSDKSGLMLFTGLPGTGKSSLIKYLSQENQDIKFCFINNSNLDILSSPNFTEFCMSKLQNSIIILEDCEKALLTRDLNKGYDISNILNLTDGIYGDILNIKIIATLNTVDKIDIALLRKGRLICKSEFKKLTIEQGKNLAKKLGKNIEINEELQLCEIYNTEDNGISSTTSSSKVGFSI